MPELEDVEYSRAEAIQAVRGYYAFLANMYMDSSRIAEPPGPDGWPQITLQRFQTFGKTDEVIALLRQLPYIAGAPPNPWGNRPHAGASIYFHDYTKKPEDQLDEPLSEKDGDVLRLITEDGLRGRVPPHVVGLISGGDEGSFLLDTKLGIVHWTDCPTDIQYKITLSTKGMYLTPETNTSPPEALQDGDVDDTRHTTTRNGTDQENLVERIRGAQLQSFQASEDIAADDLGDSVGSADGSETTDERDPDVIEQILDDPYMDDWCPEVERDWRGDSGKWTITDFFEVLKLQFRALNWVPISNSRVLDVWSSPHHGRMLAEVQKIWHEHGWPEAEARGSFDKAACLAHIRRFLCEKYPDVGEILDMYP